MNEIELYIKNTLNPTYNPGTNNHPEHNSNPLYWDLLLGDIKFTPEKFKKKVALDFGCGKGRNVTNMLSLAEFERVDGVDISPNNIAYCKETYQNQNSIFYLNNGSNLQDLKTDEYDFIIRIRTDCYIEKPLQLYELKKDLLYIQNGYVSGYDRHYSDWFAIGNNIVMNEYCNIKMSE
jgi:SAM-dependent methyltransferase